MKKYFILIITLMMCMTIWSRTSYQDYAMESYAAIDTISMLEDDLIYAKDSIIDGEIENLQDTVFFEDFPMIGFILSRYRTPGDAEGRACAHCYNEQNYDLAVKYCTKAAKMGDEFGLYYLGLCYYNGNGVEQNYKTAVKWFKKAAKELSAGGGYYLGLCYYYGKGVSQNYKKAAEWLKMAASEGSPAAVRFLKEHAEELGYEE